MAGGGTGRDRSLAGSGRLLRAAKRGLSPPGTAAALSRPVVEAAEPAICSSALQPTEPRASELGVLGD